MAKKHETKGVKRKRSSKYHAGGPLTHAAKQAPLVNISDSDVEVSEEDAEFVGQNLSNLGFLTALNTKAIDKQLSAPQSSAAKAARELDALPRKPKDNKVEVSEAETSASEVSDAGEDVLQKYERIPRVRQEENMPPEDGTFVLPIKTVSGALVYSKGWKEQKLEAAKITGVPGVRVEDDEDGRHEEDQKADENASEDAELVEDPMVSSEDDEYDIEQDSYELQKEDLNELRGFQVAEDNREDVRQQIAVAATQLLQEPEAHLSNLQALLGFAGAQDQQIAAWAMLSLAAVFKDILPGYRIRLHSEAELAQPLSKEVRAAWSWESSLLKSYQAFLKAALAAAGGQRGMGVARTAVRCMCLLLPSRFSFNYASDLLQAVVPRMAHRDPHISALCISAIKEVFERDVEGAATREAVQLVADLIKRKKCVCPSQVVSALLCLVLSEADIVDGKPSERPRRIGGSKKPPKRRKKKKDEVAADFEQASALPDAQSLRQQQSDTLEVLFEIFFRVLKQATSSVFAVQSRPGPAMSVSHMRRKFPLLEPSLQGLARFCHRISMEYLADILDSVLLLINAPGLPLIVRLNCLMTASDIHKMQGEALTVDRKSLYEAFFNILASLPLESLQDGEQASTSQDAESSDDDFPTCRQPQEDGSIEPSPEGEEPMGVLIARLATQMLLDQGRGQEAARLAAMACRLVSVALQLEPNMAMGMLAVVDRLLRRNQKLRCLLDNEGGLTQIEESTEDTLETAAGLAQTACLWELALCAHSVHSHMALASQSIAEIPLEGSTGLSHPLLSSPTGPEGVSVRYNRGNASKLKAESPLSNGRSDTKVKDTSKNRTPEKRKSK